MDIDYTQHEYGKIKRKLSYPIYDPRPNHLRFTSNNEIDTFRNKLLQHNQDVAILHVFCAATFHQVAEQTFILVTTIRSMPALGLALCQATQQLLRHLFQ